MSEQRGCCRLVLRLLFSHVGLFLLVCLYAALGSWLFVAIEHDAETALLKERYLRSCDVNDSLSYLSALFFYWRDKGMSSEEWMDKAYQELKALDTFIVKVTREFSYDGTMDEGTWSREWSFGNGLLYSVTILTTIGYGHISPHTQLGKVATILYALFGIPLTLVFLANVGELMATAFRFAYSRLCCRWCRARRRATLLPAAALAERGGRLPPLAADVVGQEEYMPTDKVVIPVVLNMLVISLFILLGAGIFAYLEDWDLLSSGYFTFITLTTIGFGDYYPGRAFEGYQGSIAKTLTLMGTCFYMMLGMALVSMCISLMQEQLITKVKWFAHEVGLLKQPDIEDTQEGEPISILAVPAPQK